MNGKKEKCLRKMKDRTKGRLMKRQEEDYRRNMDATRNVRYPLKQKLMILGNM